MADPFFDAYAKAFGTEKADTAYYKYLPDVFEVTAGQERAARARAEQEYQLDVQSAKRAAAAAKARRAPKGKGYQPSIFDALAERWQDVEMQRLGVNSSQRTLFARPAGLGPSSGGFST